MRRVLPSPIAVEQLVALRGLTDGFPACYGNADVTIIGDLICGDEPDQIRDRTRRGWTMGSVGSRRRRRCMAWIRTSHQAHTPSPATSSTNKRGAVMHPTA